MKRRIKLGVNIDHVATLRQARREDFPDVGAAASLALDGGADSIVAHLREDRRHIQDKDIYVIRKLTKISRKRFDLEMAATDEMLKVALDVKPDMATIVPEKRQELTTEGGLDVKGNIPRLKQFVKKLEDAGIRVSLFIDPVKDQIRASSQVRATFIEIHTGTYAGTGSKKDLKQIADTAEYAKKLGLRVNAGHGLDYDNAASVAKIPGIEEFNIGFSIIARSVFVGIKKATSEMKKLLILAAALLIFCSGSFSLTTAEAAPVTSPLIPVTLPLTPEASLFKDVPSDHWAESSVNQLVKMGVSQGYPDGTFMGDSNVSRYETAVLIAKLSYAVRLKAAADEKLAEEFKSEVAKERYIIDQYKKKPDKEKPFSFNLSSRFMVGNIVTANSASSLLNAHIGPVFDYRLISSYKHEFGSGSFFRVGIDTMDSAVSPGRDLVREMLEAEALVRSNWGLSMDMTSGPGLIVHKEGPNNIFPSENNKVFIRPNNGIKIAYDSGVLGTGIGYKATAITSEGMASVNDIYGYLEYQFNRTFMGDVTMKYSIDCFNTDLRGDQSTAESTINMYEMTVSPASKLDISLKIGVSGGQDNPHNLFTEISLISRDFLRAGSEIRLFADKTGESFFDQPTYQAITGVNLFDKLYQAGTYDMGLALSQAMSEKMTLKLIADLVTGPTGLYGVDEPKSNSTFEIDMIYAVIKGLDANFMYRTYQDPSAASNATSDMLAAGLVYNY
jgi:pyridoxine 5-phosphate synthase